MVRQPGDPIAPPSVEEAYASCAHLAHTQHENFTVVTWLLPREKRRHAYAIYAFCRTTDDLGDEASGDRLARLDQWEEELRRCYLGEPRHPVMVALQETIRQFDIPDQPFLRLIEANRMDQRVSRYPTYSDLLHYCQHSANPVGHMVLYLFGHRDAERQRLSDATCTALQLTNFWQDVKRDLALGRVYIPLEDMAAFHYSEEELRRGVVDERFRALMRFQVERTWGLFREGLKLVDTLEGMVRLDVALFSVGGLEVLKAIERQDYDVLGHRPTVSRARKAWLTLPTLARLKLRGHL